MALSGCTICTLSAADPQQFPDPQTWWQAEWERAGREIPNDLVRYRWETTDTQPVPPGLILSLQNAVRGDRHHSLYRQLASLEATAAGNPPRGEWVVWCHGDSFRVNNTPLSPPELTGGFSDYSVSPAGHWSLGPGVLDRVDPRVPEPGYDYRSWGNTVKSEIRLHLSAGIHHAHALKIPMPAIAVTGEMWRISARNATSGAAVQAEGRWIETEHRGEIASVRITLPPGLGTDLSFKADPAVWNEVVGAWVTPRLAWFRVDEQGRDVPSRTTALIDVERISQAEFDQLTAVPSDGRADPIRGAMEISRTRDGRAGVRQESRVESGEIVTTPLPLDAAVHDYWWLRITGWVSAGLLVLALVFLRFRKATC